MALVKGDVMRWYIVFSFLGTLLSAQIALPHNKSAKFRQVVTSPKGKKISYAGELFFGDKEMIKWIYKSPTKKEICADAKRMTVVDHDLEQVTYYKLKKGFSLSNVLKRAKETKRKNIFTAKYDGVRYTIRKGPKADVVDSVAYNDKLDNKVQILFFDLKDLKHKDLRCTAPAGYDKIRE